MTKTINHALQAILDAFEALNARQYDAPWRA